MRKKEKPVSELYQVEKRASGEQAAHMARAQKEGTCVFCQIDFSKNKPLDRNGNVDLTGSAWKYWWIWWNPFPQNHQRHLVFVLKRHVSSNNPEKIYFKEWFELMRAFLWAIMLFKFMGGGFDFRFGDTRYNAGTIPGHFHAQIQAPWGTGQVLALFYPDLSPLEQARTANRIVYKNELSDFEGYVIHSQSYTLNKNFHWERFPGDYAHTYVHTKEALSHISAIFSGNELRPEWMVPAKCTKGAETAAISDTKEPFTFHAALDVANVFNEEAYERETVLGYAFENSDGFYLSRNFEWNSPTRFVHAEQAYEYILAVYHDPNTIVFNAELNTIDGKVIMDDGTKVINHLKRYFYR